MVTGQTAVHGGVVAEDVTVRIGRREIVHGVDLAAHPGEILALVGPNGCGKSTLLSAVSGVRAPESGTVRIGDIDVHRADSLTLARARALVTQQNRADTPFTVREVVEMGRFPWTRTPQAVQSEELIDAAIAECGLEDLLNRPFPQLSGGQQARVSLARALAQDTPVLLLDEPTAALDIGHTEQVLTILSRRAAAGATVILVVHDLTLAAAYADRVAVMKAGRLLATGAVDEVMTADLLSETYDHPVLIWDHPDTGERIITPAR
ncbi:heme ABC transporter ATP-binding protein [Gordonia sp. LUNF6]|uniref:heme ABC transporter ATP-binding protein n=1 Tax=Gordonia TaxID=2053 RepID=UPI0005EE8147|nr:MULTISPECIES: heme ABC transporter ATP-binding protein [Gordonia]KJR07670.1 hemin ABC transporter ATP-binding protein [Gordonia sihwensis]KXT57736.1 hemin ABC transporter ATP-binding protein [Gordonia sp. QH-12]WFN94415.1 heme ABC transporter ATP-binding protein [Gordonia sihwensis]